MPISTPDDFRRIATEQRDRKAQEITLPSGLVVMAYQPSPEWWIREVGRLPQSMAARVIGIPVNGDGMTAETLIEFAKWSSRKIGRASCREGGWMVGGSGLGR